MNKEMSVAATPPSPSTTVTATPSSPSITVAVPPRRREFPFFQSFCLQPLRRGVAATLEASHE